MANYITALQFTETTGITANEVEATGSESVIRDARITEAQKEFERDVQKTFDGTEDDYALAQRAIAFLTAHLFRLRKIELIPTSAEGVQNVSSPFLSEYRRLKGLIHKGKSVETTPVFGGGFKVSTSEDLPDKYQRPGFVEPD